MCQSISILSQYDDLFSTLHLSSKTSLIKNYHLSLSNMYYVSGLLCLNSAFFIFVLCKVRINKGQEQLKNEEAPRNKIRIIKESIMSLELNRDLFLSGMQDTM